MRVQPNESRVSRFFRTFRKAASHVPSKVRTTPALLLTAPAIDFSKAATPWGIESNLTMVLALLAGVLGLSASLLYRHMHQRELELRTRAENAEAELRALLMMTDDAVLVLSEDGTIRATNPASEELFDRAAEDFIGEPLTEVIAQPLCLAELSKHGPVNFTTTACHGEGKHAQVEMLLSPVELSGRASYLAIVQPSRATIPGDTTGTASRAESLSKEVEKFTHDLNNHLTTVLGNLSLILMAPPADPKNQERILNTKKTALRAQSVSQKLQLLVQDESGGSESESGSPDTSRTIVQMSAFAAPPPAAEPEPVSRAARILILDDEEAICALVANVLDAAGFEVTEATSVPVALRACEDARKSGNPFALVICDLSLPGGMTGIQAAERLREIDPGIKSIVSSGYDGDPIMRDCRKYGFIGAIAKPYELSKLMRAVGEALGNEGAAILRTA